MHTDQTNVTTTPYEQQLKLQQEQDQYMEGIHNYTISAREAAVPRRPQDRKRCLFREMTRDSRIRYWLTSSDSYTLAVRQTGATDRDAETHLGYTSYLLAQCIPRTHYRIVLDFACKRSLPYPTNSFCVLKSLIQQLAAILPAMNIAQIMLNIGFDFDQLGNLFHHLLQHLNPGTTVYIMISSLGFHSDEVESEKLGTFLRGLTLQNILVKVLLTQPTAHPTVEYEGNVTIGLQKEKHNDETTLIWRLRVISEMIDEAAMVEAARIEAVRAVHPGAHGPGANGPGQYGPGQYE